MKREKLISKIDLAVVLSIFIGISYALTYLYYAGKFNYYSIPLEFIDVNNKDVFFTMFLLSPVIFNLFTTVTMKLKSDKKKHNDHEKTDTVYNDLKWHTVKQSMEEIKRRNQNSNLLLKRIEGNLVDVKLELLDLDTDVISNISKEEKKRIAKVKGEINRMEQEVTEIKEKQKLYDRKLNELYRFSNQIKKEKIKTITVNIVGLGIMISGIIFFVNTQFYIALFILVAQIIIMILTSWLNKKEKYGILFILIASFLILLSFGLGVNASYLSEKYITFEVEHDDNQDYIVLAIYKDQFLYAPIDKQTMEVKKQFNIIGIEEAGNFSKSLIGRIQMKEN